MTQSAAMLLPISLAAAVLLWQLRVRDWSFDELILGINGVLATETSRSSWQSCGSQLQAKG